MPFICGDCRTALKLGKSGLYCLSCRQTVSENKVIVTGNLCITCGKCGSALKLGRSGHYCLQCKEFVSENNKVLRLPSEQ